MAPMTIFDQAFDYTMIDEGGGKLVDNPMDNGGITRWGISLRLLRSLYRDKLLLGDAVVNLTEDDAKAIYFTEFWKPLHLELCRDIRLAIAIFNQGVLKGVPMTASIAQNAGKLLGCPIKVDGILGPESWKCINSHDPQAFLSLFVELIKSDYELIARNNPTQEVFLKGWLSRADRLLLIA